MNLIKWKGLDIDPMIINESHTTKPIVGQVDTSFNESTNEAGITVLYPKIEAIHAGSTRNSNHYLADKLRGNHEIRSGVYSWTAPYPKPVIFNHDTNTECTGRVYSASYSDITQAGRPGIICVPKITHRKTIEDILEGRLMTVSIGATTNAAVCSICGTDIINEGYCGHMRGEEYEGQVAEWICGDIFFDELSWVNVPADSDAIVTCNGINQQQMLTGEKVVVTTLGENTKTAKEDDVVKVDGATVEATAVNEENEHVEDTTVAEETTTVEETAVEEEATVEDESVEEANADDETAEDEAVAATTQEEAQTDHVATVEEHSAEEQLEEATQKIKELEEALEVEKQANEGLKEANLSLAKELHESVVDFLVDLRMAIGKESNKEEAKAKFAERSVDSLKDSISDIFNEKQTFSTVRTVERVEKPKGASITESTNVTTENSKVMSKEDIFINLLSAKRN